MGPLGVPILAARRSVRFAYPRDFLGDWLFQNSTRTGGATAPSGAATAITMTDTAASAQHRAFLPGQPTGAGTTTLPVYAKAGTINFIQLLLNDSTTTFWANFNLGTGAQGAKMTGVASKITAVGGSWYLCEITVPTANGTSGNAQVLMIATDAPTTAPAYLGDGLGTVVLAAAP